MSRLTLPLTVRTSHGPVDVVVEAAGPLPWRRARGDVLRAAGLPPGTPLYLGVGPVEPDWLVGSPPLLAGAVLATAPADEIPERPPVVLAVVSGPDAGRWLSWDGRPVVVGRDPSADLALTDPQVSFRHALLRPTATGLAITDLSSTNGIRVDGDLIPTGESDAPPDVTATTGSLIRIGGTLLQIQLTVEPAGPLMPDGAGHLVRTAAAPEPSTGLPPIPDDPGPPPQRSRRPIPLAAAAIGAVVGGTLALVLGSPIYLAFAALGPVTMVGSAISDRISGRRSHRQQLSAHRKAVAARTAAIAAAVTTARHRGWRIWPDPATLLRRAAAGGERLWDRRPGGASYLRLAVGAGTGALDLTAAPPAGSAAVTETARPARPDGDATPGTAAVTEIPVTVDLRDAGALGLSGGTGRGQARWMLLQLAALHSPSDVALVLVGAGPDLWPCRNLPHVHQQPRTMAPPPATSEANSPRSAPLVIGSSTGVNTPDMVVVLDGAAALRSPAGQAALAACRAGGRDHLAGTQASPPGSQAGQGGAPGSGPAADGAAGFPAGPARISVLCLANDRVDLPAGCATVTTSGTLDATGIGADQLAEACRALAPLRDGTARARAALPATIPLTDLTGPLDPDALRRHWQRPSVRAVLGVGTGGPATVDLDADGPHLLIAGTTGSGKSELLQTLIAALAVASGPESLTFLLIDYKGGAAFDAIATLPHVTGVVTDLDPTVSSRALESLRAELRRREQLVADRGPAPPRLVIVIDEFATLAAELPEFLAGIVDIAQRGRALGLHLVLATQRPAGVVSPAMRSNISARICLRVTDTTDSLDVIDLPDAARISPETPGRGLLRTGAGVVAFQSALVTAPVAPELLVRRRCPDGSGTPDDAATGSTPPAPEAGAPTVLQALVDASTRAATGRPAPSRPWLPPLPDRFRPDRQHRGALALADLPHRQARRVLSLPRTSVLICGPAGSGRSTALRRIATVTADGGAELFVVDAAGALADLAGWPAVSSYLTLDDPHLVLRLLTLLADPGRRPTDHRPRWLLVDGYDLVAAALDRADYLTGSTGLAELPARAAGHLHLAAAGPPSLQHQRQAAGFPTVITLDGGAAPPGRGHWSGDAVQLADAPPGSGGPPDPSAPPDSGGPPDPGAPPGTGARPDPSGPPGTGAPAGSGPRQPAPEWADALVVRPLPEIAARCALPAPRPDAVPLGAGGDDAGPVTIDLQHASGAIVVAGPRRSGVSTTLTALTEGALRCGIPVLRVVTGIPAPAASAGVTTVDLRPGPEPLRAALAAHTGPVLVVVDQSGTGAEHPAAELLERFCQVCGPGQHLLLGERLDVLARAHRGHLRAALAFRRGVLLAPDAPDGALLDVTLPRRTGPVPPGRGVWAQHGHVTPVQVGWPDTV